MNARFCKAGDIGHTNSGCQYKIIEYAGNSRYLIEFQDDFKHRMIARGGRLREGKIANPYFRGFNGQGYIGIGKYNSNRKLNPAYLKWMSIWRRIGQVGNPKFASYIECTMDIRWESLQDFSEFYYSCPYRQEDWELDKDIIVPGNKMYGPDTAAYVPTELNLFFVKRPKASGLPRGVKRNKKSFSSVIVIDGVSKILGVFYTIESAYDAYKNAKEADAARLADKYEGVVDPRVTAALRTFKVDNYVQ